MCPLAPQSAVRGPVAAAPPRSSLANQKSCARPSWRSVGLGYPLDSQDWKGIAGLRLRSQMPSHTLGQDAGSNGLARHFVLFLWGQGTLDGAPAGPLQRLFPTLATELVSSVQKFSTVLPLA